MDRLESVILIKTLGGLVVVATLTFSLMLSNDSEPLPIAVSGDVVVGEVHEPLDQVGQTTFSSRLNSSLLGAQLQPSGILPSSP